MRARKTGSFKVDWMYKINCYHDDLILCHCHNFTFPIYSWSTKPGARHLDIFHLMFWSFHFRQFGALDLALLTSALKNIPFEKQATDKLNLNNFFAKKIFERKKLFERAKEISTFLNRFQQSLNQVSLPPTHPAIPARQSTSISQPSERFFLGIFKGLFSFYSIN